MAGNAGFLASPRVSAKQTLAKVRWADAVGGDRQLGLL